MPNPDRPQASGYLANLMARLFREISGKGPIQVVECKAWNLLMVAAWPGWK